MSYKIDGVVMGSLFSPIHFLIYNFIIIIIISLLLL